MRLSAIGDTIHTVPAIRAIQDQWPETKITWIVGKPQSRLFRGMDDVEFIVFDKKGGWGSVRKLRIALRNRRFDVLLHMQVAARANLLSCMVRAPVRIGWDELRSRELHHWFVRQQVARVPFQHQVQGFLEFPRAMGIKVDEPRWNLPVSEEAREWVGRQLPESRPLLVISACSSHELRNWRPEYYAAAADYAIREKGMQVVLSGGPDELEVRTAALIEENMAEDCLNLVGRDTLEQSKAMLQRADLVITPDSGPAHIADALGTPVLGLYAATWPRRSGPYSSQDLCIDRFEQAALKYRNKPPEALRWGTRIEVPGVMDLIQPEDVMQRLDEWCAGEGNVS